MNPAQPQPASTTPNPKEDISTYLRLHEKLFKEAKEEYAKGDLIQAGEKLWGAVTSLLNAIAETRGWKHENHRDYYIIVKNLFKETGDAELLTCLKMAEGLHTNFYHNFMDKEDFEKHGDCALKLINKLKRIHKYHLTYRYPHPTNPITQNT